MKIILIICYNQLIGYSDGTLIKLEELSNEVKKKI